MLGLCNMTNLFDLKRVALRHFLKNRSKIHRASFIYAVFIFPNLLTNNKGYINKGKKSQAMTSHKLFSHSESLGAIIIAILGIFIGNPI